MEFEPVIGLETHVQLKTKTKIFCGCSTEFGQTPNSSTCPVCLGLPGSLPVLNTVALKFALKTAFALNCKINPQNQFARKNYFYPDLPKAYQISQFDLPLAEKGHLVIDTEKGEEVKIGITRLHMEEDAGKLVHSDKENDQCSLVDYNRTGIPLIEIVSEPDITSPQDARLYMLKLKSILEYLEVSDCNMEEGSLRCDANISLRPKGSAQLGTKTELKNLNSFKFLQKALEYEIERQKEILEDGGRIVQETRLWDTNREVSVSMRSKEEAHDYRYFPEPDLVIIEPNEESLAEIQKSITELPDEKKKRFVRDYNIPPYDAGVLVATKAVSKYFEESVACLGKTTSKEVNAKTVSNWVMGEVLRELKNSDSDIAQFCVTPQYLAKILESIDKGTISGKIAKTVFEECVTTGKDPEEIIRAKGLVQISDPEAIKGIIADVLERNPGPLSQYLDGKHKTFGFFVGEVMKSTRGKANPAVVNQLLREELSRHGK